MASQPLQPHCRIASPRNSTGDARFPRSETLSTWGERRAGFRIFTYILSGGSRALADRANFIECILPMSRLHLHLESHAFTRIGWLRAAVLGANDGIVSTSSLIVGVAASEASRTSVLIAGAAALVAGAMSMAAGEYVSVSSQADTEKADLAREKRELATHPEAEHEELARIYEGRGVEPKVARSVAVQMMANDALAAHARDELGISEASTARPLQAAFTSALTFTAGAAAPLLAVALAPASLLVPTVAAVSLACLVVLGALGARAGRAPLVPSLLRVTFWGALAMVVTAGVGRLFGTTVG